MPMPSSSTNYNLSKSTIFDVAVGVFDAIVDVFDVVPRRSRRRRSSASVGTQMFSFEPTQREILRLSFKKLQIAATLLEVGSFQ